MKTIVIGLGNPILGDDGVGWRVAGEVQQRLSSSRTNGHEVHIERLAVGGLSLMEHMIGYDRAILIDALYTCHTPPGTVRTFTLDELPDPMSGHTASPHDTTLQTAIQTGRRLGAHLPEDILIVAIEAQNVHDFSEQLSPAVAKAIPVATEQVLKLLGIRDHPTRRRN